MALRDDIYFSNKNKANASDILGANETWTGDWEYVGHHKSIGVGDIPPEGFNQ